MSDYINKTYSLRSTVVDRLEEYCGRARNKSAFVDQSIKEKLDKVEKVGHFATLREREKVMRNGDKEVLDALIEENYE
ncbi:unnamed protein product, partial [marine sediment metagenome]